jgi:RNA polymerase sigma-70 factor (ECF subfamily)
VQPSADTHDFESVYRAHHGFVWRTLRHLGVDPGRVDDAVQDTFMVVHRRLGEFAGRAAMRTWLFEIARRVAGRYRRTAAREAPRNCEVPELESAARPDDDLAKAEAAEILTLFLDELDRDKSVVFIMAELEQRRAPEIAETLELNLNTVYARLRAARQQLDRLIIRLQARERRPKLRRAAEVIAVALLLEVPRPRLWTAAPLVATATTAGLASHTVALSGLALGAVVLFTTLPDRDQPPPPPPAVLAATTRPPPPSTAPVPSDTPLEPPPLARPRPAKPSPTDDLARELALIEPARAALLAGDTRTALRLTARHRARFADGVFALEAAAAHIEALCRGGDRTAASPELTAFQQRWPTSPLHAWLHTVCADEPTR